MSENESKKVGVSMLSGIKAAEASLRRGEMQDLIRSLPAGHPLEKDVERLQSETDGDLGGLPDGHPLLLQMQQAKDRYEQVISEETQQAQEKTVERKKATKRDRAETLRTERAEEEKDDTEVRGASHEVNMHVDGALSALRDLYEVMSENEEVLERRPLNRARLTRLKRMMFAFERGLSEGRMGMV